MTIVDFSQWATSGHSKSRIGSIFSFCYTSRSSTSVADSISLVTTTRESRAFTLMDTTEAARSTLVQNHSKSLIFQLILIFETEIIHLRIWQFLARKFKDGMNAILGVKIEMRLLMGFFDHCDVCATTTATLASFFYFKNRLNFNQRQCEEMPNHSNAWKKAWLLSNSAFGGI